jgi:hypothetical protein
MMQCSECDLFTEGPGGQAQFRCHPFKNVKEPECLVKWQLIKLDATLRSNQLTAAKMDQMVRAYQATVDMYQKLAPLQEKMFRHMERELDDIDEGDSWKLGSDDDYDPDDDDDDSFGHP